MTERSTSDGPPGRGRRLIRPLRHLTGLVAALSMIGAFGPGRVGRVAGQSLVALLIAAPVARVLFLAIRWRQLGDRRFSTVAVTLLGVLAVGTAVALGR